MACDNIAFLPVTILTTAADREINFRGNLVNTNTNKTYMYMKVVLIPSKTVVFKIALND